MPIVYCPNCSKRIQAPAEGIGKRGQCPACKSWVTIPATDQEPPRSKPDAPAATRPLQNPVSVSNRIPLIAAGVAVIALIVGSVLYFKRSAIIPPTATATDVQTPTNKGPASSGSNSSIDVPQTADTRDGDASTPANLTEAEHKAIRRDELDKLRVSDPARWQTEMDWLKIHDSSEWLALQARDREAGNATKQAELTDQYLKREEQRKLRRNARAESNKFKSATDKASQTPADATSMDIGGSPPNSKRAADPNAEPSPDAAPKANPDGSGTRGYFTGKPGGQ